MNENKALNDVYTIRIPFVHRRVGTSSPYCESCKNGVVHLTSLQVRKFTQSGKLPNVCRTCNKEFLKICRSQIRNMSERVSLHACTVCGKNFIHAGNLKKHVKSHDKSLEKNGKKREPRSSRIAVNGEVSTVAEPTVKTEEADSVDFENRRCVCKQCDKEVINEFAFLKHCQYHVHNDNMHACLSCNELFENPVEYKAHMLSHEEKCEYLCNICPITFVKLSVLKNHCMNLHEKVFEEINSRTPKETEKPQYKCNVCSKSFIQKAAYFRHCEQHIAPESYTCTICKKVFTSENRLRIHEIKHKSNSKSTKSKRNLKFQCKKCKQSFKFRKTYTKHIKTHK